MSSTIRRVSIDLVAQQVRLPGQRLVLSPTMWMRLRRKLPPVLPWDQAVDQAERTLPTHIPHNLPPNQAQQLLSQVEQTMRNCGWALAWLDFTLVLYKGIVFDQEQQQ